MPIPYIIGAVVIAAGYAAYKAISDDDSPSCHEIHETRDVNAEKRRQTILRDQARALIARFDLGASESDVMSWLTASAGNRDWAGHPTGRRLLAALEDTAQWKTLTQQIRDHESELKAMDDMLRRLSS